MSFYQVGHPVDTETKIYQVGHPVDTETKIYQRLKWMSLYFKLIHNDTI